MKVTTSTHSQRVSELDYGLRGAGVGMGRGPSLGANSPTVLRAAMMLQKLPPGPVEASVKVEQGRWRAWRVAGAAMIGLL